jgi:pilus assembly protein CpaB
MFPNLGRHHDAPDGMTLPPRPVPTRRQPRLPGVTELSNVALRYMALTFAAAAIVLGINALRLSSQPEPGGARDRESSPRLASVVAVREIEAGRVVAPEDVTIQQVEVLPDRGFVRLEDVLGRRPARAVAVGEPLRAEQFEAPGPFAKVLDPDERAIAVKVDGVVAIGGFIEPGDRVDVLFYVASSAREVAATQARVLLEDVRVLAFGSETRPQGESKPQPDARQAVLAVKRDDVATLMLGASAGRLRLALRANREAETSEGAPTRVARLRDVVAEASRPVKTTRGRAVVVYRGGQREEVRP